VDAAAGPSRRPAVHARGHSRPVLSLAFDPRGHLLASTSADGTLRLWDARPLLAEGAAPDTLAVVGRPLPVAPEDTAVPPTLRLSPSWSPDGACLAVP